MINLFKKICRYIYRKHDEFMISFKLKEIVLKQSNFLSIGSYKVIKAEKILIYLDNEDVWQFIDKNYYNFSNKKRGKVGRLFDSFFNFEIVASASTDFSGQLLMLTIDKDIKIFDFNGRQVLTIYKESEKILQIKHAAFVFSPFFDHTLISFSSEGYQLEELVNQKYYHELSDIEKNDIFKTLVFQYIEYFSSIDNELLPAVTTEEMCRQLKEEIPVRVFRIFERFLLNTDFKTLSWKRIFLHGDLNDSNLVLCNTKVKIIDFERSKFYIFIFDIFNFIYVNHVSRNNYFFLSSYYKGEYDILLTDLFEKFRMKYEINKKTEYMLLFMVERLIEKGLSRRWFNNDVLLFLQEIEKLHVKQSSLEGEKNGKNT